MTAKLNVSLTQSYRLSSDGERNFTVEQLVTVDPTKAPGWAAKKAADPTLTGETREEWRDTGNFFAMTAKGLAQALEFVSIRQAVEDMMGAYEYCDLREFAACILTESERMRKSVVSVVVR